MQVTLRQIGNSQGIVIPKPVLAQLGLEGVVEMTVENDALVLRKPAEPVRTGWAEASREIARLEDDKLVLGDFANADDDDWAW